MSRETRDPHRVKTVDSLKIGDGILQHSRLQLLKLFGQGIDLMRTQEPLLTGPTALTGDNRADVETTIQEAHERAIYLLNTLKEINGQKGKLRYLLHGEETNVIPLVRPQPANEPSATIDQLTTTVGALQCIMPLTDNDHPHDFAIMTIFKTKNSDSPEVEWYYHVEQVVRELQKNAPLKISAQELQNSRVVYLLDTTLLGLEMRPQWIPIYLPLHSLLVPDPSNQNRSRLERRSIAAVIKKTLADQHHIDVSENSCRWISREHIVVETSEDEKQKPVVSVTNIGVNPLPFYLQVKPTQYSGV